MRTFLKRKIQQFAAGSGTFLNKRTANLSQPKKKMILALFCILFGGFSIYIIAISMTVHGKSGPAFIIPHTPLPGHIGKNFIRPAPFISTETFERVENFKRRLDSMARTDSMAFKTLMQSRPRLIDSITQFEKLYYSQTKK